MYFLASKFFAALASDGAINEEGLSVAELERVFAPLRQQVSESVSRQEHLLARIQVSLVFIKYASFLRSFL